MPTKRPRHMVTETPPVQDALDALRSELGMERLDMAELVVLGAEAKLAELRRGLPEAAEARSWLARQIRDGTLPVDAEPADRVKRLGLLDDDAPA